MQKHVPVFRKALFGCFLLLTFISCGDKEVKPVDPEIQKLEEMLAADKSEQNELALIGTIFKKASEQTTDQQKEVYFNYGAQTCEKLGYTSEQQSFVSELLKCCYKSDKTPSRLAQLAKLLDAAEKKEVAKIVNNALYRNFKSSPEASKVSKEDQDLAYAPYIKAVGEKAFDAEGSTGLNREEAIKYVDLAEAFAMVDPRNAEAPAYLWKGAEMSRNLGSVDKALNLYSDLAARYPDYEKSADALFLEGYIFETAVGNLEAARRAYTTFLTKYPESELADDAQFLLNNLGKTDKELLETIQTEK